ncbi:HupE/UreJ family protein [Rhizobium tubonense]|uniref:Protein hupE n=1 Tax=Rhizobium tubonense TaxID=484088 RepID=A0A2W4DFN7_9HYPH|nr:HupE/UreJ family protein [Rhizobium tubonense]PZM15394.1 protein hupE [Rhizobium tubonense]
MRSFLIGLALSLPFVTSASAHPAIFHELSFAAGVAHPLSGLDHIAAMVAVGMWAAMKGNRALWLWPLTFVGVMLVGGVLGLADMPVPFVEPGILASVVVLGLMVTFAVNPPPWLGAGLIGVFALLHGHAHGTEIAHTVNGLEYVVGFVVATVALHAVGIGLALALKGTAAGSISRLAGVACTAVGIGMYAGVL